MLMLQIIKLNIVIFFTSKKDHIKIDQKLVNFKFCVELGLKSHIPSVVL